MSDAELPVYFWHIPKTAGSTMTAWLDAQVPPSGLFRPQLLPDLLEAYDKGALADVQTVRGHFADAPLALLSSRPVTITVLREPVARTMSHLAHVARDSGHPLHDRVRSHDGNIDAALQDLVVRRMVGDFQARYLALPFRPPVLPEADIYRPVPPAHRLAPQMAFEFAPLPPFPRLLARALRSLRRIDFVGTVRGLEDLTRRVAASRGWSSTSPMIRENSRPDDQSAFHPSALTTAQHSAVRRLTRTDTLLYARVRSTELARTALDRHGPRC